VQVTVDSRRVSLLARARPWVAAIVAAIILALVPLVSLQLIFVVPLIGLQVKVGQQIAKVGNSGNTTEPHLHIQAQTVGTGVGDIATIDAPALIRTLRTTPLVFTDVVLSRGGSESRPANADPRRGDLVRPAR
jgi:hypothetical protein